MRISILANFVFVVAAFLVALILGKAVFAPLAFAILLAFLLYPASRFLEKKLPRVLAIIIVFLGTAIVLVGIIGLFSSLLKNVISEIRVIDFQFEDFINACSGKVSDFFGIEKDTLLNMLKDNAGGMMEAPLSFFSVQLFNGTTVIFSVFLTGILAFLLILYRTAFKNFIIFQLEVKQRSEASKAINDVQSVAQQYIFGLMKAMVILGLLNSLGLWIIGIKFPLFWGFFAAFLAIVPYIGTFTGGLLPFLFAIITTGTIWQPIAVVALFSLVQFLDDNFIQPKIVGSEVDINPFIAILTLIMGGVIWGIPGFVLALPYIAIFRIILENFKETQPIAALMSSGIYDKPEIFREKFSGKKYSLGNLFKRKKKDS